MKKLLVLMFCAILLVGIVSSAEWDNKVSYKNEDKTVEITNWLGVLGWLGLNDKIGEATLTSHKEVSEVRYVMPGEDRVVMYYDFDFSNEYVNGLGDVYFTDMEKDRSIEKEYHFAKKVEVPYQVPTYQYVKCKNPEDGDTCDVIQNGTRTLYKDEWIRLENSNIPAGNITIGLVTDVDNREYVDAVWTIAGKEVSKHASWQGSWSVDLNSTWKKDESGTDLIAKEEVYGILNLTVANNGNDNWVSGKDGNAYFTDGNDDVDTGYYPGHDGNEITINMWVNVTSWGEYQLYDNDPAGNGRNCNDEGEICCLTTASSIVCDTDDGSTQYEQTVVPVSNQWAMFTLIVNSTSFETFLNGTKVNTDTAGNTINLSANNNDLTLYARKEAGDSRLSNMVIDEINIWNRSLTAQEISDIWDNGAGSFYVPFIDAIPNATQVKPVDFFNSSAGEIEFNWTCEDDFNLTTSTLTLSNGSSFDYDAEGLLTKSFQENLTMISGNYSWNVSCIDNSSNIGYSGNRNFTVNIPVDFAPVVYQLEPSDYTNFSINPITLNYSCYDDGLVSNTTLYINNIANETTLFATNDTGNISTEVLLPQGIHTWNASCTDNASQVNTTNARTFTIDTIPPVINIHDPRGTFNFKKIGENLTVNWNVSDAVIGLNTCWYEYAGTNYTVTCSDNTTEITILDRFNKSIIFFANDTLGNIDSNTTSWDYNVLEINQTYNNITTEGAKEDFFATVSIKSGLTISNTTFFYNDTSYAGENFVVGDTNVLRILDFQVPNVPSDETINFNFLVILSDTNSTNLTTHPQNVTNFALDDCSSFGDRLFTFNLVDEELQTPLSTGVSMETAFNVYSSDKSQLVTNFSETFNTSSLDICFNFNVTNATQLLLDSTVKYQATNYSIEYYNIVNSSFNANTTFQNITLYDLLTEDATEFQVTFKGEDFVAVSDALIFVNREYLSENVFKTVELPKTDSNGQTIVHLVRNDIVYTLQVVKDNEVLGTFSNIRAFCEDFTIGDCKIDLNAFSSGEDVYDYNSSIQLIFSNAKYNSTTGLVSFDFVTADGTAKDVRMEVLRNDVFGNNSICNQSVTSSGGTLSCTTPTNLNDATLLVKVFVNNVVVIQDIVVIADQGFGEAGYLVFFVFMIVFVMMLAGNKEMQLIGILLGFITSIGLGIINGAMLGIGSAGLWLIIVIVIMLFKLNKNRQN